MRDRHLRIQKGVYLVEAKLYYIVKGLVEQVRSIDHLNETIIKLTEENKRLKGE